MVAERVRDEDGALEEALVEQRCSNGTGERGGEWGCGADFCEREKAVKLGVDELGSGGGDRGGGGCCGLSDPLLDLVTQPGVGCESDAVAKDVVGVDGVCDGDKGEDARSSDALWSPEPRVASEKEDDVAHTLDQVRRHVCAGAEARIEGLDVVIGERRGSGGPGPCEESGVEGNNGADRGCAIDKRIERLCQLCVARLDAHLGADKLGDGMGVERERLKGNAGAEGVLPGQQGGIVVESRGKERSQAGRGVPVGAADDVDDPLAPCAYPKDALRVRRGCCPPRVGRGWGRGGRGGRDVGGQRLDSSRSRGWDEQVCPVAWGRRCVGYYDHPIHPHHDRDTWYT